MSRHLIGLAKSVLLAGIAVLIGLAATFTCALIGHQVLDLLYGDDLSVIDDTRPMIVAVWTSCLVGIAVGLGVHVLGWRRLARGRRGIAQAQG